MAYRNFSDVDGLIASNPIIHSSLSVREAPLSALDRAVLQLAKSDRKPTASRGKIGRIVDWVFGRSQPNRLADDRLEALRRFAIVSRTGRCLPGDDQTLRDVGYTDAQITEVRRSTAPSKVVAGVALTALCVQLIMAICVACTTYWRRSGIGNSLAFGLLVAYLGLPLIMSAHSER